MLEAEHHVIAKIVGITPVLADTLEEGGVIKQQILQSIVEFMRVYADKCHHGKEEDLLFPALADKGVPMQGCPIGALVADHVTGRSLAKRLSESTEAYGKNDPEAYEGLISSLRGIAAFYPGHIWKEDYLLFPMTKKVLNAEELSALYREFEAVDLRIGRSRLDRLTRFADELEKQFG
jgi:hemerythrin-like domain-containing protein